MERDFDDHDRADVGNSSQEAVKSPVCFLLANAQPTWPKHASGSSCGAPAGPGAKCDLAYR